MSLILEQPVIDLRTEDPAPTVAPPVAGLTASAAGLVQACRPYQWAKNVAVLLVPGLLVFALGTGGVVAALAAFVVFCLAASSVYLLNDVMDRRQDLEHPTKRHRPVASGVVSPELALGAAGAAAVMAVTVSAVITPMLAIVVTSYLLLTAAYSLGLKQVPYVDVGVLAAGFVLRVLGGAVAVGATASPFLLAAVFTGATFIALGKRRSELVLLGAQAAAHRTALGIYTVGRIDEGLRRTEALTVLAFGAWIVAGASRPLGIAAAVAGAASLHGAVDAYRRVLLDGGGGDPTRDLLASPLVLLSLAMTGVIALGAGVSA